MRKVIHAWLLNEVEFPRPVGDRRALRTDVPAPQVEMEADEHWLTVRVLEAKEVFSIPMSNVKVLKFEMVATPTLAPKGKAKGAAS